jgi:type IV pilus assembly protein PilE
MMKTNIKSKNGFTLIELMIVVAIMGILAAVAYPSYRQHVIKSNRVDAEKNLLELTQWMERFYTENGRYDQDRTDPTPVPVTIDSLPFNQSPTTGTTTFYNMTFTVGPTATTYTLTATPTATQDDAECGAISLNHASVKCILAETQCSNGSEADQDAVADCW